MRRVVTLVPKGQCAIGRRIRVVGVPDECLRCKLKGVCLDKLRAGATYEIVEVRRGFGVKCLLTGDEVVPVVVEERPIILELPPNLALEGVVLKFSNRYCNSCPNCPTDILKEGDKVKILRVLGVAKCGDGSYRTVEVEII